MRIYNKASVSYYKKIPNQLGMSFLEIMIVIVIMAGIASIVGPAIFERLGGAKVDQTKIQMRTLSQAFDLYYLDNNIYPSSEQGLDALLNKPEVGVIPKRWKGPYLKANGVPLDGWGNEFQYESEQRTYKITSLGGDGLEGGEGDSADITTEDL